jgi:hypothetical protein
MHKKNVTPKYIRSYSFQKRSEKALAGCRVERRKSAKGKSLLTMTKLDYF